MSDIFSRLIRKPEAPAEAAVATTGVPSFAITFSNDSAPTRLASTSASIESRLVRRADVADEEDFWSGSRNSLGSRLVRKPREFSRSRSRSPGANRADDDMGRDRDSSGDDDMGGDASGRFSGDDRDSDHEDGGGRRGRGRGRERRERRRGGRDEGRRQSGGGQRREWKYDPSLVWSCLSNNPHVAQGHMGQTDATKAIPQSTASFRRTLVHGQANQTDGDTRGVYRRRVGELKTAVQWLQRNYLITEIEFLTQHGYPHCTVVIAGSAPATHVKFLSQLFPDATFHLFSPPLPVDYVASSTSAAAAAAASSDAAAATSAEASGSASQPNQPAIVSTDRIRVHAEPFSDAIAAQFAGAHALFVSELRSGDPLTDPLGDPETKVAGDMEAQVRWARLMRAHKCLLRFRLPWTAGLTQYLDGEIFLPVWGPQTGTETRLVCDHDAMRVYDNQKYEGQMFHFNTVTRSQIYAHGVIEMAEGLDHCFDCRSEVHVLEGYMRMAARRARAIGLNLYPPVEVYRFASPATASAFGAGEEGAAAMAAAAASQQVPPLTWDAVWALMPAVLEAKAENVMHRIAEFSFDISRELSAGAKTRTLAHAAPQSHARRAPSNSEM